MALASTFPVPLVSARIHDLLGNRGVTLSPLPGERAAAHRDRLDTELMALFRDTGSDEVFDALYRHARGRVFQWVRWLVSQRRCPLDPVDLLQDTFVNVYRYAHSFRSENRKSFRSWVRTIASNALRRALSVTPRQSVTDLPPELQEPVDPKGGPHAVLTTGEETAALREAWYLFLQHYANAYQTLSPRDRRALELVEVEGLTYAQTAQRLKVGSSNMKMIMLRSRRRLHKRMRAAMGSESPHRLSA
jgi:RNA polymerase sigma factor (sigma-70 family)